MSLETLPKFYEARETTQIAQRQHESRGLVPVTSFCNLITSKSFTQLQSFKGSLILFTQLQSFKGSLIPLF